MRHKSLTSRAVSTFVLVHGGWHGAWCWHRVTLLLERLGHAVVTPDLPGHGGDLTPVGALSLRAYADRISIALDAVAEPAVLVGHSLGGMVISQAAEDRPDKVRALVYLAAFLPGDGQSLNDLAQSDPESLLTPNSVLSDDGTTVSLREYSLREALYADCPDEDFALARRLIRPEPLAPLLEKVRLTAAGAGRVPRFYIECLQDRALPLARQRLMQAAQPCAGVASLRSGHSPFFSVPESLVEYLARFNTMTDP